MSRHPGAESRAVGRAHRGGVQVSPGIGAAAPHDDLPQAVRARPVSARGILRPG
ncbi:hypothetical protein JYU34_009384 [Plutella xylostella]|uniref:Uncharacterized protein n=1 Tax=Plutella xylostella TaxID=51655 RepID=A0ABQ7QJG1_PLUXY|nr:hypothetical protein JYU34_009384 [Plutella xylostella]